MAGGSASMSSFVDFFAYLYVGTSKYVSRAFQWQVLRAHLSYSKRTRSNDRRTRVLGNAHRYQEHCGVCDILSQRAGRVRNKRL